MTEALANFFGVFTSRNTWTILRREFAAYFKSAIGYIFIVVFLLVSVWLYMWTFFVQPRADMRSFFGWLPIIYSVFLPAVTMRLWAEDRSENTYELLLTFPMKTQELVVGKFLASLLFLVLALAGTFTVPLMLGWLGDPDGWVIVSAYLGAALMGALFLALGIFVSGFFSDQIIAFVITLLGCFGAFLVGTDYVAQFADGWIAGLGTLLKTLFGVTVHYDAFTRGVIELSDILFFGVWIALFLTLNAMFVDVRHRRGGYRFFAAAAAMAVLIGMAFNYLMLDTSLMRLDMTEDSLYTISPASSRLLGKVKVPIQIKLYVTERADMPTGLKNLERDIRDKLQEMKLASGGKISYQIRHPRVQVLLEEAEAERKKQIEKAQKRKDGEAEDEEEEAPQQKSMERVLLDKGVEPFMVLVWDADAQTSKHVYAALSIAYKEKDEEYIRKIVTPEMSADSGATPIDQLEYRIVSMVVKLTRDSKPVVAVFSHREGLPQNVRMQFLMQGRQPPPDRDNYRIVPQLLEFENYDVRRTKLEKGDSIPEDADALAVLDPQRLNDRQKWEINRFLHEGGNVFLAIQRYTWEWTQGRQGFKATRRSNDHGLGKVLKQAGLGIDDGVLMDVNSEVIGIVTRSSRGFQIVQPLKAPLHIRIHQEWMNADVPITSRLGSIFYPWGTALTTNAEVINEKKLKLTVLITTSDQAWKMPASTRELSLADLSPDGKSRAKFPVMVLVEGQFGDAFAGKPRPAWPPKSSGFGAPPPPPDDDEAPPSPAQPKPGRLILIGNAQMFSDQWIQGLPGNRSLAVNAADTLALNPDLIQVRNRKPINRTFDRPTAFWIGIWKLFTIGFVPVALGILGIVTAAIRIRRRNTYTAAHSAG